MKRREFALAGLSAAALALHQTAEGQEKAPPKGHARDAHDGYSKHFRDCAQACSDCQRECDRCAIHCAQMMAAGKDHHEATLRTCLDCADFCAAAAQIVSRGGPFSSEICTACADACKQCAAACRKHGDSPEMKACAEECEKCEKACRGMLAHNKSAK